MDLFRPEITPGKLQPVEGEPKFDRSKKAFAFTSAEDESWLAARFGDEIDSVYLSFSLFPKKN